MIKNILNKVKEKMLYPLKLIPILKSNIKIILIGVIVLLAFFIVAPDLWYSFIDILPFILFVLLGVIGIYLFTKDTIAEFNAGKLANPNTPDNKRKKIREDLMHYLARRIVVLVIIICIALIYFLLWK